VTGIGVGQAFHAAGRGGLDGIVRLTTDGKLHIHCGVGNLVQETAESDPKACDSPHMICRCPQDRAACDPGRRKTP
jgi:hypothetical protein